MKPNKDWRQKTLDRPRNSAKQKALVVGFLTKTMKRFFIIIFVFSISRVAYSQNPVIEIYFLKKRMPPIENQDWPNSISKHFNATKNDIQDTAFILDSEILSYDSIKYNIIISTSASLKISRLEPGISEGIQFVLTVNKEPVLNGYFINKYTSSVILSHMIMNRMDSFAHIDRVMPGINDDDRKAPVLLNAFKATGRLQ